MTNFDRDALINGYRRKVDAGDKAYASLVIILVGGGDQLVDDELLAEHRGKTGIAWPDLLSNGTWSDTEEILVTTAVSLFRSGDFPVSVGEAVAKLDGRQFVLWTDMINARRTGTLPEKYTA